MYNNRSTKQKNFERGSKMAEKQIKHEDLATRISGFLAYVKSQPQEPAYQAFKVVLGGLTPGEKENFLSSLENLQKCPEKACEFVGKIPQALMKVSPELRTINYMIKELTGN